MNKENFYRNLMQSLLLSEFKFRAIDFSSDTLRKTKMGMAAASAVASFIAKAVADVHMPKGATAVHPVFEPETVQRHLDEIREYAGLVCFKYILAQPLVAAVVEADKLADHTIIELAKQFDEAILKMRDPTATMGIIPVKMSVTGIMLFVFFDHTSASKFVSDTQAQCKITHFWKKTNVVPWAIDVSKEKVISHQGIPFLVGIGVSPDSLQKTIFQ